MMPLRMNESSTMQRHFDHFQGQAILFAPRRGDTFDKFVNLASGKFEAEIKENYDDAVWDLHRKVRLLRPPLGLDRSSYIVQVIHVLSHTRYLQICKHF